MSSHSSRFQALNEASIDLTPGQQRWLLGWQNRRTEEWDSEFAELWWPFVRSSDIATSVLFGGRKKADDEIARSWWRDIANKLTVEFERRRDSEHGQPLDGRTDEDLEPPLPSLDIGILAIIAICLAEGKVPSLISNVRARGAQPRSLRLVRLIEIAVYYVRCAKAGGLTDLRPIKSVSDAFGVSRQTVQGWVRRYSVPENMAIPCNEQLFPIMRSAGKEYSLSRQKDHRAKTTN
jgi:hypothetical protein